MRCLFWLTLGLFAAMAHAQFELQDSTTSADLRGIVSVGNGVAWASGTHGTVLRTEDSGFVWQGCAMPPAAETLDFRGIQAFDGQTALVMSSGKGDLSRVYKTTDGCLTWKLVFTNPDAEGFFDAIQINARNDHSHAWGYILGDPVDGHFVLFFTSDGGDTWSRRSASKRGPHGEGCKVDEFTAEKGEAVFAASNESLISLFGSSFFFVTGGTVSRLGVAGHFDLDFALCHDSAKYSSLQLVHGNESSGAFAFAATPITPGNNFPDKIMIVGGDYKLPNSTDHNAILIRHPGIFLQAAQIPKTPPHGYRSSIAYAAATKTWITVGPNGTDTSTDDGRNWKPLHPATDDAPDADRNWNALSLPFVVGPHGRIGRLRDNALLPAKHP